MALDNIPYSLRAIARAIAQGSAGTNEIKTLNQIAAFIGGPTCPKCGVALVKKFVRRTGEPFWGCPTFPIAGVLGLAEMEHRPALPFRKRKRDGWRGNTMRCSAM